jgi:magnesium-transporting ATPase (P-type)
MADHKVEQVRERLVTNEAESEYKVTKQELCDLFHPDNIKNKDPNHNHLGVSVSSLYYKLRGVEGIVKSLDSDVKTGIDGSDSDLNRRKEVFGKNDKTMAETKTLLELILECFEDAMLKILLLAALVASVIGVYQHGPETGWIEGASIFFAVGIIVTVTAGNNYMKEKQFQELKLRQQDNQQVPVFRGAKGETITVPT